MSKLSTTIAYLLGVATGFAVATTIVKKKCMEIADKEIASVKEAFSKETHIYVTPREEAKKEDIPESYEKEVKKHGYAAHYKSLNELKEATEGGDDDMDEPYIISPNDFGELPDYECVNLIYYQEDGVIATESDEIIDSPDDVIGLDSLKQFGDYTTDSIFVRNDKLKCDYEILRDSGSFEEMMSQKPYANEEDD